MVKLLYGPGRVTLYGSATIREKRVTMSWYVWAAIIVAVLALARAELLRRVGRRENYGREYNVAIAIGVMCVAAGLGIVLAAGSAVFSQ